MAISATLGNLPSIRVNLTRVRGRLFSGKLVSGLSVVPDEWRSAS